VEINYIKHTKNWINSFVIALDLCPFAQFPFENSKIRYVVHENNDVQSFLQLLEKELNFLQKTPSEEVETTFLIHPHLFIDFLDYNDFLGIADHLIFTLHLEGVLQVASFHPNYQFAGTEKEAVENYTNRSPYPMLHLLREESVSKAIDWYGDTEEIPFRNSRTLFELGLKQIKQIVNDTTRKD